MRICDRCLDVHDTSAPYRIAAGPYTEPPDVKASFDLCKTCREDVNKRIMAAIQCPQRDAVLAAAKYWKALGYKGDPDAVHPPNPS